MAKKKQSVPEYGTVTRKGTLYYRTRITVIPRMHQLLESGQPLPQNFAVAPYYEMALDQAHPVRESMLAELLLLDALFAGEQA